jgi:hypothetical protein
MLQLVKTLQSLPLTSSLNASPDVLLSAITDGFDLTMVDTGDVEALTISQVAEDGTTHTVVLSPSMAAETIKLMLQWNTNWQTQQP